MDSLLIDRFQYRVFTDLAEIEPLSQDWERLLRESPCNRGFGSLEWYVTGCRVYPFLTPRVVVAFDGDRVAGILPLVSNREDRTATFAPGGDYRDIVAPAGNIALLAGLLACAASHRNGGDRILLSKLQADSNCLGALPILASLPGIDFRLRAIDSYHYVKLPETFDDYLATRSRVFRKSIRRAQRKMEGGNLVVRELEPESFPPRELPEVFLSLVSARHKEESAFTGAQSREFARCAFPLLFKKRDLRAFAVIQDETITALDICMVGAKGLCTWNGGFLSEAATWSPGTLLTAFGVRRAIEMKLAEYDFLEGEEPYKKSWATGTYVVSELELFWRD